MVICPVAIAVGCKRCPIFKVCPAKSIIGDYKPPEAEAAKPETSAAKPKVAARKARSRKKKK